MGDWNAPADSFEPIRMLREQFGFQDVAQLCADRAGEAPEATCKGATRHSFLFASPDTIRYVRASWVGAHFDLDSHAVLFADICFPAGNPVVMKWVSPAPLDQLEIDLEMSNASAVDSSENLLLKVTDHVEDGDLDKVIAVWSNHVEEHLLSHSQSLQLPVRRYKGRCQRVTPRSVKLAPPRLKTGRPSDFTPEVYSSALRVRQWTKQVRRLKCYIQATVAIEEGRGRPGLKGNQGQLWDACLRAAGFPGSFFSWFRQAGFVDPMCLPSLSWCHGVLEHLAVVEESWATGGSLPFRLMKEPQAPEVLEMSITIPVKLAPQSWLPFGKSWLKVRNADDFQVGDRLVGDVEVNVLAVQCPYISISAAVSRKTAASLVKAWVEADPEVWVRISRLSGRPIGKGIRWVSFPLVLWLIWRRYHRLKKSALHLWIIPYGCRSFRIPKPIP